MSNKGTSTYTSTNVSKVIRSKASSRTTTMKTGKLPLIEKNDSPNKEKLDPKTISQKELQ